jgi:hypothetical protein
MKIVRISKKESFTVLSNHVLKQGLSLKARGLYWTIVQLPDDWDFNLKGLEAMLEGEGRYSIRSAMKELEEKGFARMERVRSNRGNFDGVEWHFFEMGIDAEKRTNPNAENLKSDNRNTDSPNAENPNVGKPKSGNLHQYNTNLNQELKELNKKTHKKTKKADVCVSDLDSDFEGLEKEKGDGESKQLENENDKSHATTESENQKNGQTADFPPEAMRTPFAVKAFASDAQAYAEAQAKAAESETTVLYKFGWVLAWLSTYQTPEDAVKRGVGEPELLELFRQAVDTSISAQKAHNPRYVQGVFRNLVQAWTPTARGKPNASSSPNLDLRNIDKQWENEPKGRTRGF